MKKALLILLSLLILVSCKKDDYIPVWHLIYNDSGYDVTLKNTKGESDVVLKKGEKKDIPSKHGLQYDIIPNTPTTKMFGFFIHEPSNVSIISYDYTIEYVVDGTAEKADITLLDDKQQRQTLKNVSLPAKFQYRTFCKCSALVSAKRIGENGYITVALYNRGKLVKFASSSTSNPAHVEAG
jgi:hypothetical protein